MKDYFDITFLANPLYEYLKWITMKIYYQTKYWGNHLRIGYKSYIRKTIFGRYNYIGRNVYLVNCKIGDFTYLANNGTITHTSIGKFCSIGPDVKFAPGRHPTSKFVSTNPSIFSNPGYMKKTFTSKEIYKGNIKVTIGNDVWVGANCLILDGVVIGDGVIIAANSVVTKDVSPYSIVGGSPAALIKKRFEENEIEKLLEVQWWNKSDEWIQDNIVSFWDIKDFINL
jgi:chloramphenicol O-acetyltransferase type B